MAVTSREVACQPVDTAWVEVLRRDERGLNIGWERREIRSNGCCVFSSAGAAIGYGSMDVLNLVLDSGEVTSNCVHRGAEATEAAHDGGVGKGALRPSGLLDESPVEVGGEGDAQLAGLWRKLAEVLGA